MKPVRLLPPFLAATVLLACQPERSATAEPAEAAARPASPAHQPSLTATTWQCGDLTVATRFDDASLQSLTLAHSDQDLKLKPVATAVGARFADDVGNEFWSRPGKVTLALAGKAPLDCRKLPSPATHG